MYEIKDGPLPEGVSMKGQYEFGKMVVGQWFFAPGKKPSTVRAACAVYKKRNDRPDMKFSCVAAQVGGQNGTVCKRVA